MQYERETTIYVVYCKNKSSPHSVLDKIFYYEEMAIEYITKLNKNNKELEHYYEKEYIKDIMPEEKNTIKSINLNQNDIYFIAEVLELQFKDNYHTWSSAHQETFKRIMVKLEETGLYSMLKTLKSIIEE